MAKIKNPEPEPEQPRVTNLRGAKVPNAEYTEGVGFEAGNAAPHTVYRNSEDGSLTDKPVERGHVVVYQGDVVTPGIAAELEGYNA